MDLESRLPEHLLARAIKSGNEYGWRRDDFEAVVRAAVDAGLGLLGWEVQYIFPDGTCEAYWLGYDPSVEAEHKGDWREYRAATLELTIKKFRDLCRKTDFRRVGEEFDFLKIKASGGADLMEHLFFILSFEDQSGREQ